jgi:hypothetical protein
MSQASINFANSAIEQVGERHKQLVESANAARLRSRSRTGKFTSRHVWTQGELTDVCSAFILNYNKKTLPEIAQELHTCFTEYLKIQDQHQAQHQAIVESDSDDEPICQAVEYREGVPSISAIELKLIDCVNLCYQVSSGSCSKASKMHTEIWQHIMCAQKHREIIRTMKVATASTASTNASTTTKSEPTTPKTPKSSISASLEAPGAPVKAKKTATPSSSRRKYLLESEEELPAAKRRKLNPEFEAAATTTTAPEQQQQRLSMSDICYALDEIADRMEQHGQCEQQYSQSVAQSIATIRQNQSDIALLMGYVQDTYTGIQKAHERIEAELAKLETMTVVPAAATAAKPKFDPSNYQCHECSQTFDPSIRGYWLIGAPCRNPNTTEAQEHNDDDYDDMFYLCRECTRFENEHNHEDNHNDMGDMAFGVIEDGEYDYDQYEDQCERARRGDYDHSEECS